MGVSTSRGTVGTPAYMAPEQARDTHQASAASDVYALGATLLFAATGHPPYQGDTVMDVLARLATEEPDLSGLPGELTEPDRGLPAARSARSPDLVRDAGPARAVHRDPAGGGRGALLPARRGHGPDRAVPAQPPAGQRPAPPGGQRRGRHVRLLHRTPRLLPAQAPTPEGPAPAAGWRRWVKTHMAWVGWVSVGAALIVGGVILGASLSSSGSPSVPQGLPPAPPTVCGTFQAPPGPSLCMVKQSQGTPSTAFVVEGNDFAPGKPVTFMLSEIGPPPEQKNLLHVTSPLTVVVGPDGTFRVPVSQIYSGALPLGQVTLVATTGNSRADTDFMVIPSEPPPGGTAPATVLLTPRSTTGPPGGSATPGRPAC